MCTLKLQQLPLDLCLAAMVLMRHVLRSTGCPLTAADSMLMGAIYSVLHTLPTDPGYGYYRPNVRLFDPGWNGLKVKGSEDESTGDNGNDPLGVISR